jgi:hypothetical protein
MVNICFSTTDSLFSRFLRWFMSSRISHALVTYHNPVFDRIMVLEARQQGFVSVPWKRWKRHNKLVARYSLRVPDERLRAGLHYLSGRLGDQFDVRALFGFLFRGRLGRNLLNSPSRLFCSEAVAGFLQVAGVELERRPGDISPKELLQFAQDNPEIFCLEEHLDDGEVARSRRMVEELDDVPPPSQAQFIWPPLAPLDDPVADGPLQPQ